MFREQSSGFHEWQKARSLDLYVGQEARRSEDWSASWASLLTQWSLQTSLFSSLSIRYQFLQASDEARKDERSRKENNVSNTMSGHCEGHTYTIMTEKRGLCNKEKLFRVPIPNPESWNLTELFFHRRWQIAVPRKADFSKPVFLLTNCRIEMSFK